MGVAGLVLGWTLYSFFFQDTLHGWFSLAKQRPMYVVGRSIVETGLTGRDEIPWAR
jgi:hypothetical protein